MSLKPESISLVPELTARVARAAFPKGSTFIKMRDELGVLFTDELFASLFPHNGQPALAPWRLALVTIMQFSEGLSDRDAADAVRGHIDWKYALSLELEDSGFDFSVLSEFRARLIAGNAEYLLFETMLNYFKEKGLVKAGGRVRTDSTHILAAVRALNRALCVGETLRAALNSLAVVVPEWLRGFAKAEWYERYGHRIEESHFPKEKAKRQSLVETMGVDGYILLSAIYSQTEWGWLSQLPAVQILRRVWVQQFELVDDKLHFRTDQNIPPGAKMISSPYDIEVTTTCKSNSWYSGYKVHLTESCDEDSPRLITHVETTRAGNGDVDVTPLVHKALSEKKLLPKEHLADTGYGESKQFVESWRDYGIDMIVPARGGNDWQSKANQGFDSNHFDINWEAQTARCPTAKTSASWTEAVDRYDNQVIKIKFSRKDCKRCEVKAQCTKNDCRTITVRPKEQYLALQQARARQAQAEFKEKYKLRAGIEGTISQGVRGFGMRRTRYRGLKKTHLEHLIIATAINLRRYLAWMEEIPLAKTRTSHFATLAA
jgi:transposase